MASPSSRVAAGALALGFIFSTTLLAGAKGGGLIAGIGGTVSGALGGSASGTGLGASALGGGGGAGSIGTGMRSSIALDAGGGTSNLTSSSSGNASGTSNIALSGPSGTVTSGASSDANFATDAKSTIGANTNGSIKTLADLELQQRAEGTVKSISPSSVTMVLVNGTTRTYQYTSGAMASAFHSLVGSTVMLRSADGAHVTSLVGKSDVVRGKIIAIEGDTVAYASSNGEVHLLTLAKGGVDRLKARLGSIVVSASNDFGRTAQLAVLALKQASILGEVTIGKIDAVGNGEVAMQVADAKQTFAVSGGATAQLLASLRGTTVALDVPDGYHVKSVFTSKTLDGLLRASGAAAASGALDADVIKTSKNSATVQLRNGDVVTYTGNIAPLHLQPGASVTLTSSDAANVQLKSGTHVAHVTTSASATGVIVAQTPTTLSVQFPNGDVRSFVGDAKSIGSTVGAQATVGPADSAHVRVTANGHQAVLVDAKACATINAGCGAEAGIVTSVAGDRASIALANGETLTLGRDQGAANLHVDSSVIVQPLNSTNVIVSSEGNAVAMVSGR